MNLPSKSTVIVAMLMVAAMLTAACNGRRYSYNPPQPQRLREIDSACIDGRNYTIVRDVVTGREFLAAGQSGMVEILPRDKK